MKKRKVAFGLWVEMVFITAFCLIIGIGVGGLIAQPVTDSLLAGQIASAEQAAQNNSGGKFMMVIGGDSSETEEVIDKVDVSLGMDTVLEIAVISLLLASLAGFAAISKNHKI